MNLPRTVLPTSNQSAWVRKLLNYVQASTPCSSGDINVVQTPYGSALGVSDSVKGSKGLRYDTLSAYSVDDPTAATVRGLFGTDSSATFHPHSEYRVGQVIRVLKTYHAGYEKPDGNLDTTKPIYVFPCIAICVSYVPPYLTSTQKSDLQSIIANGNIGISLGAELNDYIRKDNVCYAPLIKEWEPVIINDYFDYNGQYGSLNIQYSQGRFWEVWSLLPTEQVICKDGIESKMYINGTPPPSDPSQADGGQVGGPGNIV